jgi:hypothetical protein
MRKVLALAAIGEAATGLMLIVYPAIVVRLLCGLEINGSGVIVSRIFGISLVAMGVACWPAEGSAQPLYGMLTYTALAALYLIGLGISGDVGILLWPAVGVHVILTFLLGGAYLRQQKSVKPRELF